MMINRTALILISLLFSYEAFALEVIEGKVTMLEPTYMPGHVTFQMDTGNTTCPAGSLLVWNKANTDNANVVYSTLLAAMMSGKNVRFHFNDNDTSCLGQYLHLVAG